MTTPKQTRKIKAVRRDAKLKNLPPAQRDLIIAWHLEDGEESCRSRILSELHISGDVEGRPVSNKVLYEALAFWRAEKRFSSFQNLAMAQAELESEAKGGMSAEAMHEAVDRNFIMLAAETEDTELYRELRMLRIADQSAKAKAKHQERALDQKDADLKLAREKFEFDAAKAVLAKLAELRTIAKDRALSEDDKIAQVRLRLWGPAPLTLEGPKT